MKLILKTNTFIYFSDIELNNEEYNLVKGLLDWLRSERYGSLTFERRDKQIDTIVTKRNRLTMVNN